MEHVFQMIGAAVVGISAAGYLFRAGTVPAWLVMTVLLVVQVVSVCLRMYFGRQRDRWRYHEAYSVEEKEEISCFAWDFAGQESYNYKNGRIFVSMRATT